MREKAARGHLLPRSMPRAFSRSQLPLERRFLPGSQSLRPPRPLARLLRGKVSYERGTPVKPEIPCVAGFL